MRNLLITTTNSIEGKEVREYFTPITSSSIVGTNILSELKAGLTDFFGGRSGTYEKRLQKLYDIALDDIKRKAMSLGANGIIGMRVDSGEINGKNTQMFKITVYGTPVVLADAGSDKVQRFVDGKKIDEQVKVRKMLSTEYEGDAMYNSANLELIATTDFPELLPVVLKGVERFTDKEVRISVGADNADNKLEYLYQYFDNVKDEKIVLSLYDEFKKSQNLTYLDVIFNVITYYDSVNLDKVKELLIDEQLLAGKYGMKLLNVGKRNYGLEDVPALNELKRLIIQEFPPRGRMTTKKKMLSSAEKDVWECECGKTNDAEYDYCNNCNNDIYGFKKEDVKPKEIVELLEGRIAVINNINQE